MIRESEREREKRRAYNDEMRVEECVLREEEGGRREEGDRRTSTREK